MGGEAFWTTLGKLYNETTAPLIELDCEKVNPARANAPEVRK
jgi:hypothetical protein